MTRRFMSLITKAGREKIAAAAVTGEKVLFSQMSVGDGSGAPTEPSENQSSLVNEQFRTSLNSLKIQENERNIITAEAIIPPQVGGFTIREAALFDEDGICMAVACVPETYKPALAEGSGRFTVLRIWLVVSSTDNIELRVDPGIVLATVEDVINVGNEGKEYTDNQLDEHAKSLNHPDATLKSRGFTQLSNAIDSDLDDRAATPAAIKAAIAAAVQQAWELDNPVGSSRLFNQNLNPNERWPWSRWEYAGEHLTIRTAKEDGTNVGDLGGSDTVTIARANLPAEEISVSGTAQDTDLGTKRTKLSGKHVHHGVPKRNSDYELGGNNRVFFDPYQEGDTDEAGEHDHEMELGPHSHPVAGKTDALGQGQAISVVERHKLQMLWHRIA